MQTLRLAPAFAKTVFAALAILTVNAETAAQTSETSAAPTTGISMAFAGGAAGSSLALGAELRYAITPRLSVAGRIGGDPLRGRTDDLGRDAGRLRGASLQHAKLRSRASASLGVRAYRLPDHLGFFGGFDAGVQRYDVEAVSRLDERIGPDGLFETIGAVGGSGGAVLGSLFDGLLGSANRRRTVTTAGIATLGTFSVGYALPAGRLGRVELVGRHTLRRLSTPHFEVEGADGARVPFAINRFFDASRTGAEIRVAILF